VRPTFSARCGERGSGVGMSGELARGLSQAYGELWAAAFALRCRTGMSGPLFGALRGVVSVLAVALCGRPGCPPHFFGALRGAGFGCRNEWRTGAWVIAGVWRVVGGGFCAAVPDRNVRPTFRRVARCG